MSLTLKSKIDEIDIIHLKYNTHIDAVLASTYTNTQDLKCIRRKL